MADMAPEPQSLQLQQGAPRRTDPQVAAALLHQAETDLRDMTKMASDSEGGPFPFDAMSLATQVVDMALKSAMLRLQGLTREELVGHHFSVLHRRLQYAAVRHTKQNLPGDVCDMEWLKSIHLATHASSPQHNRVRGQRAGHMKDAHRAGRLAHEIFHWVRALLDTLSESPKTCWEAEDGEIEDDRDSHASYGSYDNDFEEESPKSARARLPLEAWTAPEVNEPSGLLRRGSYIPPKPVELEEDADDAVPEEAALSPKNKSFFRGASEHSLDALETVMQYTNMARRLRAKGLMPRAIRMVERALMIASRFGQEHPALAMEACKVRLNFAAYLSEAFRHREALKAIKETQEILERLMQWAAQCRGEELDAQALGQEARTLHCCTIIAEAMVLDLLEDGKPPSEEIPEKWKEMVRAAISGMPADHPLRSLVRRALGHAAGSSQKMKKRSSVSKIKGMHSSHVKLTPFAQKGEGPFAASAESKSIENYLDVPKPETPMSKQVNYLHDTSSRHKRGAEEQDLFKQYLRDLEMARVAHLLSLSDDWETQARRKLDNFQRKARFELELIDVDELKEKRYTKQGHKVFMQQLLKMNKSASDPSIRRAARRDKTAPETFQLKKLSRKIKACVKPQAPPPPPPTPPFKPKVDEELTGGMKMPRGDHGDGDK